MPLKIVAAITHTDEITLDASKKHLWQQSVSLDDTIVVSGVSPASAAFNQCLDFAVDANSDVLIHIAADCLLRSDAVAKMLARLDLASTSVVTARGFDMTTGVDAPIGAWALNMRLIGSEYRFRDVFKMDLDFCSRLEEGTGSARTKTKRGVQIGCHHPIWTPEDMYRKFLYNAPKYKTKFLRRFEEFFLNALSINPDNRTLKAGLMGLHRGSSEVHSIGGPQRGIFSDEWAWASDILGVQPTDFFAYHDEFIALAREMLNSEMPIKSIGGKFFPRSKVERKLSDEVGKSRARLAGGEASAVPAPSPVIAARPALISGALQFGYPLYKSLPNSGRSVIRRQYLKLFGRVPQISHPLPRPHVVAPSSIVETPFDKGRADWAARWSAAPEDKRVLLLAPKDFAGSMYKWAEALNRHTNYAARLVTFARHQYGYSLDVVAENVEDSQVRNALLRLCREAAILHLKDEHTWFMEETKDAESALVNEIFFSPLFAQTPKVFTFYGGYARKFKSNPEYIRRVQTFQGRVAMTPDLNYDWFDGRYIPHAIDMDANPFSWESGKVFSHSPSSPEKKASFLFEEAILELSKRHSEIWSDWSTDLIHGVSFAECIARKQKSTLFFDQAGRHRIADLGIDDVIGWYGNSAIEAMACGIPTIAHMSELAFSQAARTGHNMNDIPVLNIDRSRESMVDAVAGFIRMPEDAKLDLARKTRDFTMSFHGYAACADQLVSLYEDAKNSKLSTPLGHAHNA